MQEDTAHKYRAPALEKGLEVLELLAACEAPLTLSQISVQLDRSVGELFRVVQVLETRGYAAPAGQGDGLELTNKVFSLGISRGPDQNLVSGAVPYMQAMSALSRQACHLAIASDDTMIVIARTEAPEDLGFAVRLGHQRHLCESTSGIVLYAFQRPARRKAWGARLRRALTEEAWRTFEARAQRAVAAGHVAVASAYVDGVVDISCPVMDDTGVIAALTMPFIRAAGGTDIDEASACLKVAAGELSRALGYVR